MDQTSRVLQFVYAAAFALFVLISLGWIVWGLRIKSGSERRQAYWRRRLHLPHVADPDERQELADLAVEWDQDTGRRLIGDGIGGLMGMLASLLVAFILPIGQPAISPIPMVRGALTLVLALPGWGLGTLVGRYFAVAGLVWWRTRMRAETSPVELSSQRWFVGWRSSLGPLRIGAAVIDAIITLVIGAAIVTQIQPTGNERDVVAAYLVLLLALLLLLAFTLLVESAQKSRS